MIAAVGTTVFVTGALKGVVGLGLSTGSVVVFSLLYGLESALCLLVAPTVATNLWQGASGGHARALVARFWPALASIVPGLWAGSHLIGALIIGAAYRRSRERKPFHQGEDNNETEPHTGGRPGNAPGLTERWAGSRATRHTPCRHVNQQRSSCDEHYAAPPGLRYGAGVKAVRDGFGETDAVIGLRAAMSWQSAMTVVPAQIDAAIIELFERGEDFRGKVDARMCPHGSGQTVVLDAQADGARVFYAVGPECAACEPPHERLDTSGSQWMRLEAAEPIPEATGMTALALLGSEIELLSPQFIAELGALTGIVQAGDVDPCPARRVVWGDLARRLLFGEPPEASREAQH